MSNRYVFLDRDGTLIIEKKYLSEPSAVELLPGVGFALKELRDNGWGICVVSNQSGIARGYFDLNMLQQIHDRLRTLLRAFRVELDGIYFCPHAPEDNCLCRKPLPGLLNKAIRDLSISPSDSWMVGDKDIDIEAGQAVGASCILVRTGYGEQFATNTSADFVVDKLADAAQLIVANLTPGRRLTF